MKFLITKTNENKLKFIISIYTIIVLFCSCSINETPYSNIVSYYTKDTLKHRAALFLEQYAKYHYGVARYIVDSTNTKSRLTAAMFKNDTIYKHYMLRHYYHLDSSKPIMDTDTITESFLKEN